LSLPTTETELTEGKHYWEAELMLGNMGNIMIDISRPNLDRPSSKALQQAYLKMPF
jgi:hypothetical protein